MSPAEILAAFVFLMAYYYFVLRKYNSLGFRMFSLCFFVGTAVCYWWYINYRDLQSLEKAGVATQALVLHKSANSLTVRFTDPAGRTVERTQNGGISVEEFAAVREGEEAPILYRPESKSFFLASSYRRQLSDNAYILILPGLLFALGIGSLIFLSRYRVHAHEGTMYEYVTDENGKVVLDDNKNATTRALRVGSTLSKLVGLFRK